MWRTALEVIGLLAWASSGISLFQFGRDVGRLEMWKEAADALVENGQARVKGEVAAHVEAAGMAAMYEELTVYVREKMPTQKLRRFVSSQKL